jgi:hypothetical protein
LVPLPSSKDKRKKVKSLLQGICVDTGETTVLEKGKKYFLFPGGSNNYYVSKFPNANAHTGCFRKSLFQIVQEKEPSFQKGDKVYHIYKGGSYVEALIEDIQDSRYVVVDLTKKKRKTFIPFSLASESLTKDREEAEKLAEQYRQQQEKEWHDWITGGITKEDEWPPEPPANSIPALDSSKIYAAKLIWRKRGYHQVKLGTYYLQPARTHVYVYRDKQLKKCVGCFPLHWFEDFREVNADEDETNEVVLETEVPKCETEEEIPENFEQMCIFDFIE